MLDFLYQKLAKPILFKLDPEKVHDRALKLGQRIGKHGFVKRLFHYEDPALEQNVCGIQFKNPIGLSAGFDKDGDLTEVIPNVGFGYMQVGSITNKPYKGNPKPRLHRLKKSKGILVYYGLKNIGVHKILPKIKKTDGFPVGISIAKTNCKETASTEDGIRDYSECIKAVVESGKGDFITINISCPNVFGGEPFTSPEKLTRLLEEIPRIDKPLFLKMPINLEWEDFKDLLDIAIGKVDGVIIGNLNKDRSGIEDTIPPMMQGGISGLPCQKLSNEIISKTYKYAGDKLTIIGCGGVFSAEDAYDKIKRGATLVQLITGMIYEGPQLIKQINKGLVQLTDTDGFSNISEAVGIDNRA